MPSTQGIQWCGSLHSIFTLSPHFLHSLCPTYGSTYLDALHRSTKLATSFGCGISSSRCCTNDSYPIGLRFDFVNASSLPQSRVAVSAWNLAYHNLNTMSMLLLGNAGAPFLLSLPCLRLSVVTARRIVIIWSRSHVPCMSTASLSKNNTDEPMSFAKVFALMIPPIFFPTQMDTAIFRRTACLDCGNTAATERVRSCHFPRGSITDITGKVAFLSIDTDRHTSRTH